MMQLQFTATVEVPNEILFLDRCKLIEQIESVLSFYYGYTKIKYFEERTGDNENTGRH